MATKLEKKLLEKKLKNWGKTEGKTIVKFRISGTHILCSFTDGTWIELEASEGYDNCIEIGLTGNDIYDIYDLKELGLVTDEEIKINYEAKEKSWKAMREREDRRLYNILREKFEKK